MYSFNGTKCVLVHWRKIIVGCVLIQQFRSLIGTLTHYRYVLVIGTLLFLYYIVKLQNGKVPPEWLKPPWLGNLLQYFHIKSTFKTVQKWSSFYNILLSKICSIFKVLLPVYKVLEILGTFCTEQIPWCWVWLTGLKVWCPVSHLYHVVVKDC